MKFTLFGYEFGVEKPTEKLHEQGSKAKREQSWQKISSALDEIESRQLKFSEYRIQQISGVSINTVKKYREQIKAYRDSQSGGLFT